MKIDTRDLNVICPENLKSMFVQLGCFSHPHFFSKKDVMRAAFPFYEDEDVLAFAQEEGKTYAASKKAFENFSLFKDKLDGYPTYTIKILAEERQKALSLGLLHEPNYLLAYSLKKRHTLILGYHQEDTDLVKALASLGLDFDKCYVDILNYFEKKKTNKTVIKFNEAWVETMWGMSWLSKEIEQHSTGDDVDLSLFQIVCPDTYFNIVSSTASLFNIPLVLPIDAIKNIPEAHDIIESFETKTIEELSKDIEAIKNQDVKNKITKAIQTLNQVASLSEDLKKEYIIDSLSEAYPFDRGLKGISVSNDLTHLSPSSVLLVLGFSDNLVTSKKDNGAVIDFYKERVTLQPNTVNQNKSIEKSVKEVLNICNEVRISRSENDNFINYPPVFFNKNGWINEIEENHKYESYGEEIGQGRKDLAFYQAVFHSRFDQIRLRDPMAYAISKESPKSASLFHSYVNDFDDDSETQNYFKDYFSKEKIKLSHSSLDGYQNNPFNFYCTNVLKLQTASNFINLAGQLIHAHAERREKFKLEETLDSLKEDLPTQLEGMNEKQVLYFLTNADKVFEKLVLPTLEEAEDLIGLNQLNPSKGDEFKITSYFPLNCIATAYFDQVYVHRDGYVLVDYKTAKKSNPYVGLMEAMLGRKLQLPLYSLLFEREKERIFPKGENDKLLGSFICNVPFSSPYEKKLSNTFVGFQLTEQSIYEKPKGKRTSPVRRLDDVKKLREDKSVNPEYIKLQNLMMMQDQMTENLSFGEEADKTYPTGSPSTHGLSISQRIVSMALTSFYHCVDCLRNGRLKTEHGVKWFPVYPTYFFNNGKNIQIGMDDFDDISFVEKYQVHQLLILSPARIAASLHYNDFDNLEVSDEDVLSDEDDDDGDDDSEGGEE